MSNRRTLTKNTKVSKDRGTTIIYQYDDEGYLIKWSAKVEGHWQRATVNPDGSVTLDD